MVQHFEGSKIAATELRPRQFSERFPPSQPNRIGENVISYLNTFPKEFGLDKQVDYELQFNKSFLEPIKVIMDVIGWQPEKIASLEFLFG